MKRTLKKALCIILALAMVMTMSVSAFATTTCVTSVKQINRSYTTCDGMEKFITKTNRETIDFDSTGAITAGYSEEIVKSVQDWTTKVNEYIISGQAVVDDSCAVTIYGTSARTKGESKIVTYWWGLTEIYLNSDETQELIDNLTLVDGTLTLSGLLKFMPGDLGSTLGGILDVSSFFVDIYIWQIEAAASEGNGIIMCVQNDYVNQYQTIWFEPQLA